MGKHDTRQLELYFLKEHLKMFLQLYFSVI